MPSALVQSRGSLGRGAGYFNSLQTGFLALQYFSLKCVLFFWNRNLTVLPSIAHFFKDVSECVQSSSDSCGRHTRPLPTLVIMDLLIAPTEKSQQTPNRIYVSFVRSDKTSTQIETAYIAPSTGIFQVNIWQALTASTREDPNTVRVLCFEIKISVDVNPFKMFLLKEFIRQYNLENPRTFAFANVKWPLTNSFQFAFKKQFQVEARNCSIETATLVDFSKFWKAFLKTAKFSPKLTSLYHLQETLKIAIFKCVSKMNLFCLFCFFTMKFKCFGINNGVRKLICRSRGPTMTFLWNPGFQYPTIFSYAFLCI